LDRARLDWLVTLLAAALPAWYAGLCVGYICRAFVRLFVRLSRPAAARLSWGFAAVGPAGRILSTDYRRPAAVASAVVLSADVGI